MRVDHIATRQVIHWGLEHCFQVLNEGAIQPDIQRLCAVTNAEDGLAEVEGILQEKLIDGRAIWISAPTLRDSWLIKSLWINIISASRQQDPLRAGKQTRHAILTLMQRNDDGCRSGGLKCGKVGRQRALVVFGVTACWFGYGNANRHGQQ